MHRPEVQTTMNTPDKYDSSRPQLLHEDRPMQGERGRATATRLMLATTPLELLERKYSDYTSHDIGHLYLHHHLAEDTKENASGDPFIWSKSTGTRQFDVVKPLDHRTIDDLLETIGYDPSTNCAYEIPGTPLFTHQQNPQRDLVLDVLQQVCSQRCGIAQSLYYPTPDPSPSNWSLGKVLDMINGRRPISVSNKNDCGQMPPTSPENYILLTLTSFPFRIFHAPAEMKELLQSELVGDSLFEHITPINILPKISLDASRDPPLPFESTPCLLDDVFDCHARAVPVHDPCAALLFYAVIVEEHDLRKTTEPIRVDCRVIRNECCHSERVVG